MLGWLKRMALGAITVAMVLFTTITMARRTGRLEQKLRDVEEDRDQEQRVNDSFFDHPTDRDSTVDRLRDGDF